MVLAQLVKLHDMPGFRIAQPCGLSARPCLAYGERNARLVSADHDSDAPNILDARVGRANGFRTLHDGA